MRAQALLGMLLTVGCQDYPFETRPEKRVDAKKINEVIATVAPTDILFVIDNSASMAEEIAELRANVDLFIEEMSRSKNQFQVGVITTDVECNVPGKVCAAGGTSESCCNINPADTSGCDQDIGGDGTIDRSTCDGGRLRAPPSKPDLRVFRPPAEGERQAWVTDFSDVMGSLGTGGSSYEAGLEAAHRALACSAGVGCDPSDSAVADLNAGFIRDDADLVIIFLADEDDCSAANRDAYLRPTDNADPDQQAQHFCSPDECYLDYARLDDTCASDAECSANYSCNLDLGVCELDTNGNNVVDWADSFFTCGLAARQQNPPYLEPVERYLDRFIALKGSVSRIRAAGIVGSFSDPAAPLLASRAACVNEPSGPSVDCGCLACTPPTSFYCTLTGVLEQRSIPHPAGTCAAAPTWPGGCTVMPGGRYVAFLEALAERRVAASLRPDTLIDSICRSRYDETMFKIVNTIILTNCFDLGLVPEKVDNLSVKLNGIAVPNVPVCDRFGNESRCAANGCIWDPSAQGGTGGCEAPSGTTATDGWSWIAGSSQICLEGEMRKSIGDEFEIFLITDDGT